MTGDPFVWTITDADPATPPARVSGRPPSDSDGARHDSTRDAKSAESTDRWVTHDMQDGGCITISPSAIESALSIGPEDVSSAGTLRYARNVFIPLTTACRYTCTYCTYFDPPGEASLLSPAEIRELVQTGVEAGCTEALFTFGDDPDDRYTAIHDELDSMGYDSIHEYLHRACTIALEEGLLPHSNPGDQTRTEMQTVGPVNASMGVMLETTATVDAHSGPRRKSPAQRLKTLRIAGELGIPFTTGILVGIGETWRDRAESLLAIGALHHRYGHIQEVIVQPVVENERWDGASPSTETLRRVVAMARGTLPDDVSIQVPPNLAPARELLDCGVDDLGGVSPVTADHINPDFAWPALDELRSIAAHAGVSLDERLPIHPRYLPESVHAARSSATAVADPAERKWVSDRILAAITDDSPAGRRFRQCLPGALEDVTR